MHTPVLIPAYNEEAHIGQNLTSLVHHDVSPIVIANGCEDATVPLAKEFGVEIIELPEPSKVRALQAGLRYLGRRAEDPFITLDADSAPLSRRWAHILLQSLSNEHQPEVVSGPIWFINGADFPSDVIHSLKFYARMFQAHYAGSSKPTGANMLFHPARQDVVDALVDMPDFWPGEDRAMRDIVVHSFSGREHQARNPLSTVVTDGARSRSVISRLLYGRDANHQHSLASYQDGAPAGSQPYVNELALLGNKVLDTLDSVHELAREDDGAVLLDGNLAQHL